MKGIFGKELTVKEWFAQIGIYEPTLKDYIYWIGLWRLKRTFYILIRIINRLTICKLLGHKEDNFSRMIVYSSPLLPRETPSHYYIRCKRCNVILDDLGLEGQILEESRT